MKKCGKCGKRKPDESYVWHRTGRTYTMCSPCKDYVHELERSIPPGVYRFVQITTGKTLYVGESSVPYRRRKEHLSKYKTWKGTEHKGSFSHAIFSGEVNPKNVTMIMINENVQDSKERLELEQKAISKYKPIYNKK